MKWRPIETAPRDGTAIEVGAEGMTACIMRWNPKFVSPVTDKAGVWMEVDGPCIWSEGDGLGPTQWRPVGH